MIISCIIFFFIIVENRNKETILYISVDNIENERDFMDYLLHGYDYEDLLEQIYGIMRRNNIYVINFSLLRTSVNPGGDIFNYIFNSYSISNILSGKEVYIELKIDSHNIPMVLKKK